MILALAMLAPREGSASRAFDSAIGWKSEPLRRDSVPCLARADHHKRSMRNSAPATRKSTLIRVCIGLGLLAGGVLLIAL